MSRNHNNNNNNLPLDLEDESQAGMLQSERLQTELLSVCPVTLIGKEDVARFVALLELSWGQIDVPVDALILSEPVSAALARLGVYSNVVGSPAGLMRQIVVPLYQLRALAFIPRSLCAISEYEHDVYYGTCLEEAGFRRVLYLRLCLLNDDERRNWSAVGLPWLDEQNIPFPPTPMTKQCHVIGGDGENDDDNEHSAKQGTLAEEAKELMSPADGNAGGPRPRQLQKLFARLEQSQFYHLLQPRVSSSGTPAAIALVRVGPNKVIQFQFENNKHSSVVVDETKHVVDTNDFLLPTTAAAEECALVAEGWETVAVILRTHQSQSHPGKEEEQEAAVVKEHSFFEGKAKVTSLLLSGASVKRFLGQSVLLEEMNPEVHELKLSGDNATGRNVFQTTVHI